MDGMVQWRDCTTEHTKIEMRSFVQRLCKCESTGARVCKREAGLVVTNIGVWPQSFTDGIHSRYPSATVTISESENSTSNFKVLISYGHHGNTVYNLFLVLFLFLMMLAILFLNLHFTFHQHFIIPSPWLQDHADALNSDKRTWDGCESVGDSVCESPSN